MRRLLALAAVALVLGSDALESDDAVEMTVEGTWRVVAAVCPDLMMVEPGADVVTFAGGKVNGDAEVCYRLRPDLRPRQIDLVMVAGPWQGRTFRGIYSVERDTLRLCIDYTDSGGRPEDFTPDKEHGVFLFTMRRCRP